MSYIETSQGKIHYEPSWMEGRIETEFANQGIIFPSADKVSLYPHPPTHLNYRRSYTPQDGFYWRSLVYYRELGKETSEFKIPTNFSPLETAELLLESPQTWIKEVAWFYSDEGFVKFSKYDIVSKDYGPCDYLIEWEGDFQTTPSLIPDDDGTEEMYCEHLTGKYACEFALKTLIDWEFSKRS